MKIVVINLFHNSQDLAIKGYHTYDFSCWLWFNNGPSFESKRYESVSRYIWILCFKQAVIKLSGTHDSSLILNEPV